MDGRYKAELVSGDEYLLKLSRYINQNPVAVAAWRKRSIEERIPRLRAYRWSSYRGYIGEEKAADFVDMAPVRALVGILGKGGPRRYREYVESGLAHTDADLEEVLKHSSKGIGDQDFRIQVERLRNRAMQKNRKREDVSFRRMSNPLAPEVVLSASAEFYGVSVNNLKRRHRGGISRPAAARMLLRFSGCT